MMANPPATPPSSDIDGVDQDREAINQPKNSDPEHAGKLQQEEEEARGRPNSSRP